MLFDTPHLRQPFVLIFKKPPETDRWIKGDRHIRKVVRRLIRGKPYPGGIEKVFINLCKGLNKLNVPYTINPKISTISSDQIVVVLGIGRQSLYEYDLSNPMVAGIALMSHPAEWPDFCAQFPVKRYLQHSDWSNQSYLRYFGPKICKDLWPVGIDTDHWAPKDLHKPYDFLIYNKIRWHKEAFTHSLLTPIKNLIKLKNQSFVEINYGQYNPKEYLGFLQSSKAMIFITEHESQGIAYQEALSCDVPIFAWNPGKIIDPNFEKWGDLGKPASSVPFWDHRCGLVFQDFTEFETRLESFLDQRDQFRPREFILENLSLEESALHFLRILKEVEMETSVSS